MVQPRQEINIFLKNSLFIIITVLIIDSRIDCQFYQIFTLQSMNTRIAVNLGKLFTCKTSISTYNSIYLDARKFLNNLTKLIYTLKYS